jgi:hypothetical protein
MINYLAPILRDQFNKFYRYGYTYIPSSQVVGFDGKVSDEVKTKVIELFNTISPFEYDEDYLILHLDKSEIESSGNIRVDIQNIISIYPLSKQAKISVENKIDQRIKLEQPIFEIVLSTIEANIHKQEIEKAIDALWLICNLEGSNTELLQSIGLENIYKGIEFRKSGTKASKIKEGSYWSYLLAYDRFDFFPNTTLGFFYDAGQVFAYSKNHPTFEGSGLHNFLQKINSENPQIRFGKLIETLETEEQVKGYITQTRDNNIKQYFVSPLYLMLKEELRNSDEISQTKLLRNIEHLRDFGDNFKAAVILLGAFFGYKKFYDNYYDKLDLRFYKSVMKEPTPQLKVKVEKPQKEPIVEASKEKVEEIISGISESIIKSENPINQFQEIILQILNDNGESKISDLTKEFNKRTKNKFNKSNIINILKEITDRIETVYNGKKLEKVKLKNISAKSENTLFNIQK